MFRKHLFIFAIISLVLIFTINGFAQAKSKSRKPKTNNTAFFDVADAIFGKRKRVKRQTKTATGSNRYSKSRKRTTQITHDPVFETWANRSKRKKVKR